MSARHLVLGLVLAVAMAWPLAHPKAADDFKVWVGGELPASPEGLGFGPDGLLYAALAEAGEIYRVGHDGKAEYIASVPSKEDAGKGLVLGLDFDKDGNIFVAYKDFRSKYMSKDNRSFNKHHMACKDATDVWSGVYRVDAKSHKVTPVAVRGDGWAMCFPDDVAVDGDGNIYMSDLSFSGIWKIAPDGSSADLWTAHPLLNWDDTPSSGIPFGTNVVVVDAEGRNVYAGTDDDPMVVRVPVMADGSAGEPVMVAMGFTPLDGIELDDKGNIYISEPMTGEIKVLSPDGRQRLTIATPRNAPLVGLASLAWRDGVLCVANFALGHPAPPKNIICMSGYPLPTAGEAAQH